MDNYQVAIKGTGLAARILGIERPDVQFFYNHGMTVKGINSIFLKEEFIIAFNEEWIYLLSRMKYLIDILYKGEL